MERVDGDFAGRTERRGGVWGTVGVFTVVASLAAGTLGAVQPATGIPQEVVQLTQFGPALAVGAVALYRRRRTRELLRGAGAGAGPHPLGGAVLLGAAGLIVVLCVLGYYAVRGEAPFTSPGSLQQPFALIMVAQLVGACGEEVGWRCFLQPLLRTRLGTVAASVTVGVLWGVWHVQVFAQAPAYAAGFLVATVAMSVVLGIALDGLGGWRRLLYAGGFHALVNLGLLLFLDEESGAVPPMLCFGLSCLVVATLAVVLRGGRRAPARAAVHAAATLHRT
ncbi:CAAX prenyl protease-like protein [Streptomyces sp. 3211.6]|uniref:CPBP family intramembrane glutamic endopeptidase n=1 Tax=Streptomyces sp. 3211.6 TaxID=1938845 RepID=UPI000EAF0B7B|nr:CPBP family intramembrane glutamic endopeptidase [Streptomyces sp. 3211.6]RKT02292.1 CAAX prenyl protease-like protein [Streptomyces sp. 3211.6]